jgi:hypothetical protein
MVVEKDLEKGYPLNINTSKLTAARTPYRIYVTPFDEIYSHQYRGEGTPDKPYIVDWLPHDAENPQTWNDIYKWLLTVFVAIATLAISFCSSAYVGDVQGLMQEFGASDEAIVLGISLFVLGFAVGELIFLSFIPIVVIFYRSSHLGSFL